MVRQPAASLAAEPAGRQLAAKQATQPVAQRRAARQASEQVASMRLGVPVAKAEEAPSPARLVNNYDGARTTTVSFDSGWKFHLGDVSGAQAHLRRFGLDLLGRAP
jgi:hypothetical protein